MRRAKVLGLLFILSFTFVPLVSTQDEVIVFVGLPEVRIAAEGKEDGVLEKLSEDKVSEYRCVISKKGDNYYWKSREDKEMEKSESGIYITFTRSDGAPDYVRTINPAFLKVAAAVGDYGYIEHLTHMLSSITYWGNVSHTDPAILKH